jgi:iron complex transport system permease protein
MRIFAATRWQVGAVLLLVMVLVACAVVATAIGSVYIPFGDVLKVCWNKLSPFNFAPVWRPVDETIILQVRLPRVIGSALVGAGLGTAGVLFQGLLRNPMADPYIIGTSAGAALGATIAMLLPLGAAFLGFGTVPVLAFVGALATVFLVYRLARVGGKTPVVSMLLAGFVVSAMLTAVMFLVISLSDKLYGKFHSVYGFLMGGVSVSGWGQISVIAPIVIVGILVARLWAFRLNAFALGEEGAAHVGVDVERSKTVFLALGSTLTAAAVSIGGLIGFVGLVIPHAMRLLLGPDHRVLIPCSAIAGGAFLVIADTLARTLNSPREIPVGIITALIGAPVFIYLLRSRGKEYGL